MIAAVGLGAGTYAQSQSGSGRPESGATAGASGQGGGTSTTQSGSSTSQSGGGASTSGQAGSTTSGTQRGSTTASTGRDADFVQFAATSSQAEIQLSQLAQQRGMNSAVKQFAERMITDHMQASDMLRQAAGGSAPASPTLDAKHQQAMQKLEKLNGAQFDHEYMETMVNDHREAVTRFSREAGANSTARSTSGTGTGTSGSSGAAPAGDTARAGSTAGASGAESTRPGQTGTSGSTASGASAASGASGAAPRTVTEFAQQMLPKLQEHLMMAQMIQRQLK